MFPTLYGPAPLSSILFALRYLLFYTVAESGICFLSDDTVDYRMIRAIGYNFYPVEYYKSACYRQWYLYNIRKYLYPSIQEMNSDYQRLATTGIFCCFPANDFSEEPEVLTLPKLINLLHMKLLSLNCEMVELKQKAYQFAQAGDTDRAISELKIRNTLSVEYKQLVEIERKARLLERSIECAHQNNAIMNSMSRANENHPIHALDVDQVECLVEEWSDLTRKTSEITDTLSQTYDEQDYNDVMDPNFIVEMPSVPTHKVKEKMPRIAMHGT